MTKVFDFDGTLVLQNSGRLLLKRLSKRNVLVLSKYIILVLRERLFNYKSKAIDILKCLEGLTKTELIKASEYVRTELVRRDEVINCLDPQSFIVSYGFDVVIFGFFEEIPSSNIVCNKIRFKEERVSVSDSLLLREKTNFLLEKNIKSFIYFTDDVIADVDICERAEKVVEV